MGSDQRPVAGAGLFEQTRSGPKAIASALAGAERRAVKTIADALGTRSNLVAQAATAAPRHRGRRPQPEPELLTSAGLGPKTDLPQTAVVQPLT